MASSYVRLKPNAQTTVGFVLSPDGRKLLPKAKSGLHLRGSIIAIAKDNRKVHSNTDWGTVLK